jgi:hypothetical protein
MEIDTQVCHKDDPNGKYEGPFTRWYCHEEMAAAHRAGVGFVGVKEDDDRYNKPDFALEKSRARQGGKNAAGVFDDATPVSQHVQQNLQLLDELCFINYRRQEHEVAGMLREVVRLAAMARPRACTCKCTECVPHQPGATAALTLHPGIDATLVRQVSNSLLTVLGFQSQPTMLQPEPEMPQSNSAGTALARSTTNGPWVLSAGKRFHFFICHHQGSGGDQSNLLCVRLQAMGFRVWYDNDQLATERNLQGMRQGVRESECFLIFLSGRKERDTLADPNGEYEGPFTRWFCHEEMGARSSRCVHRFSSDVQYCM